MTDRTPPRDSVAVHRGLLAIARDRNADFNAILVQYAIERLLDRLSRSTEDRRFVLKGAMLFRVWTGELHRPTRDVDFLGYGEALARAFRATFERRGTPLPAGVPTGLSRGFGEDDGKLRQWRAFLGRMRIVDMPESLSKAITIVGQFALPALHAAAESGPSPGLWVPASGWRSKR